MTEQQLKAMQQTLERYVKEVVNDFVEQGKRPRIICICSDPKPGQFDLMYWARCINCNRFLSMVRVSQISKQREAAERAQEEMGELS